VLVDATYKPANAHNDPDSVIRRERPQAVAGYALGVAIKVNVSISAEN
jgi:hypothetical protein